MAKKKQNKKFSRNAGKNDDELTRIAIVNDEKCKPKRCKRECKRSCPVNKTGKSCIEVTAKDKRALISEYLCIGCGLCQKKCPFKAVRIIRLPKNLDKNTTHRYGPNSFKLHRLPVPRPGKVLGLVGINGIGKSTAIKILANKIKPNLGNWEEEPEWEDILTYFRGNELQSYFMKVIEKNLKVVVKPQGVDEIPRHVGKKSVGSVLIKRNQYDDNKLKSIAKKLDLIKLVKNNVQKLSGGELQRLAIALVALCDVDVYMFDEPSSYLDVKQRMKASKVIRSIVHDQEDENPKYVMVVEHDLSVLDYLSDYICVLWGNAGAYGVVTTCYSVKNGLNVFLEGFIKTENLRFRDHALTFKIAQAPKVQTTDEEGLLAEIANKKYHYKKMHKTLGQFKLTVQAGSFTDSEIVVMLGQNGTGKTTFIRMLAGLMAPDGEDKVPELVVSYKPQQVVSTYGGDVYHLLLDRIKSSFLNPQFKAEVLKPMKIGAIEDQEVSHLSGGEMQRVGIALCLGKKADIYLIDEPSAHLDSEQRMIAAKCIKRFIYHAKKSAFVVEHDFIMATYLADQVIVYSGKPAVKCVCGAPEPLVQGMNKFLKDVGITFRKDATSSRPRINKYLSVKDKEQKKSGNYFFMDKVENDDDEEEVDEKED